MEPREPTSELGIEGFEYATVKVGPSKYRMALDHRTRFGGWQCSTSFRPSTGSSGWPSTCRSHRRIDAEDRAAGRRMACPVLVHWGGEEGAMSEGPLGVWRGWADEVEGGPVPGGHFIPEEASDELTASLTRFLDS
jgi:pimeloyl-ACP methyl ester carboxylesterase